LEDFAETLQAELGGAGDPADHRGVPSPEKAAISIDAH
jgi:hypothetical protein